MVKACIFDLDGTLTDTLDSLVFSVNATLKEMGLSPITRDECRLFVGNGARRLIELALERNGKENLHRIDEGMEIYRRIFDDNCTYLVKPYEGILSMIKDLKERGIKLAVLSNKPHRQTGKVVEEIFGKDIFDYAQGQMEEIPRKPDPAGVVYLMRQMGVDKEECLYIGDSEVDVLTGQNAGTRTISVLWGFRDREVLEAAGAEEMISHPDELLQFV